MKDISHDKTGSETSIIDYGQAEKTALLLRAINHPLRRRIIRTIADNKNISVTELYTIINTEQAVMSQHLAILRRERIVLVKRAGKFMHYTINTAFIQKINELTREIG